MAKKYNRAKLENTASSQRPGLAEADEAEIEGYLDELLSLLPVLGVDFFEHVEAPGHSRTIYSLASKGPGARGFETNTGFTVLRGSVARGKTMATMKRNAPGYYRQRQELIDEGVLEGTADGYRFTADRSFSSPSAAAAVCRGRNANGLTEWKDASGNTLKANRETATKA